MVTVLQLKGTVVAAEMKHNEDATEQRGPVHVRIKYGDRAYVHLYVTVDEARLLSLGSVVTLIVNAEHSVRLT